MFRKMIHSRIPYLGLFLVTVASILISAYALWNDTHTRSGPAMSVENAIYNNAIGGMVDFGLHVNYSEKAPNPSNSHRTGSPACNCMFLTSSLR
jgi:hypothetical protein